MQINYKHKFKFNRIQIEKTFTWNRKSASLQRLKLNTLFAKEEEVKKKTVQEYYLILTLQLLKDSPHEQIYPKFVAKSDSLPKLCQSEWIKKTEIKNCKSRKNASKYEKNVASQEGDRES